MALTWSQCIHLQAVTLSRNEGATAAQIMKCKGNTSGVLSVVKIVRKALLPHLKQKQGLDAVPEYCKPTVANIENTMPASCRHQHYAKNAFASLSVFAEQNEDRVFLHVIPCPDVSCPLTASSIGTPLTRQMVQASLCVQLLSYFAWAQRCSMVHQMVSLWMLHGEG